ncbi:MAG TPA: glycosyltransferase [Acidobacteriota bacterium]
MNPPIKVVHSQPTWLPQTATWIYNQVRFLPPEVTSHIVCDRTENLEQFELPNIHALERQPRWRRLVEVQRRRWDASSNLLVRVARRCGAQVVHSHFGDTGWRDLSSLRRLRAKHAVTFYGFDVNFLPRSDARWLRRYALLFERADRILCEGPHMARCIVALGCQESKLRVQRLGVAVREIRFEPRRWQPGLPFRILIAASFREKKGIPDAIRALAALAPELPLELTIIGDADPQPRSQAEKAKILELLDRHALRTRTRLLGYQSHAVLMREAYAHHLFLSPSLTANDGDTEGGAPVSLIEMAASGIPIVSTKHCDIPEVILDGQTGLLAKEQDVPGLVRHLKWWIDHPTEWEPMLRAGRRHIEAHFDAREQGRALGRIYAELLS